MARTKRKAESNPEPQPLRLEWRSPAELAENHKRRSAGCEISPKYCAVILQRFKDAFPNAEIRLAE